MTEFIIGVVQNIGWHVHVQNLESRSVSIVATSRSERDAGLGIVRCEIKGPISKFPILFPQIALNNFGSSQES